MKCRRTIRTVLLLLLLAPLAACDRDSGSDAGFEKGAGAEWDALNVEMAELRGAGESDRAIVVAKKALEVAEKNVGSDHPDVAKSLNNLAALYGTQGDYAQAEPLYKHALAIKEEVLGPDHPSLATNLDNLAALYRATEREEEAEVLEQRATRIREMQR